MNKYILKIFVFLSIFTYSGAAKADYWLVIGTYRQGPGGRPEVSGITSPSLYTIPMKDIETCEKQGIKSQKKFISLSGNLIINGLVYMAGFLNNIIFSNHERIHHLCNFHFRKNHFWSQNKLLVIQKAN